MGIADEGFTGVDETIWMRRGGGSCLSIVEEKCQVEVEFRAEAGFKVYCLFLSRDVPCHVVCVPYLMDMPEHVGRRGIDSWGDASIGLHQASSGFVYSWISTNVPPLSHQRVIAFPHCPCALCLVSLIPLQVRRYMSAPKPHI